MSSSEHTNNHDDHSPAPFDVLRQFARRRETRPPVEQCELCTAEIPTNHRHLLEVSSMFNPLWRPCSRGREVPTCALALFVVVGFSNDG